MYRSTTPSSPLLTVHAGRQSRACKVCTCTSFTGRSDRVRVHTKIEENDHAVGVVSVFREHSLLLASVLPSLKLPREEGHRFDTCQHFAQCGLWIVCCFLRLRAGSSLLSRSAGRARPFCELARYASGKGTELFPFRNAATSEKHESGLRLLALWEILERLHVCIQDLSLLVSPTPVSSTLQRVGQRMGLHRSRGFFVAPAF